MLTKSHPSLPFHFSLPYLLPVHLHWPLLRRCSTISATNGGFTFSLVSSSQHPLNNLRSKTSLLTEQGCTCFPTPSAPAPLFPSLQRKGPMLPIIYRDVFFCSDKKADTNHIFTFNRLLPQPERLPLEWKANSTASDLVFKVFFTTTSALRTALSIARVNAPCYTNTTRITPYPYPHHGPLTAWQQGLPSDRRDSLHPGYSPRQTKAQPAGTQRCQPSEPLRWFPFRNQGQKSQARSKMGLQGLTTKERPQASFPNNKWIN